MVLIILYIDIRIEKRYKNCIELYLIKCDVRMNIKMSRSKMIYMYI